MAGPRGFPDRNPAFVRHSPDHSPDDRRGAMPGRCPTFQVFGRCSGSAARMRGPPCEDRARGAFLGSGTEMERRSVPICPILSICPSIAATRPTEPGRKRGRQVERSVSAIGQKDVTIYNRMVFQKISGAVSKSRFGEGFCSDHQYQIFNIRKVKLDASKSRVYCRQL